MKYCILIALALLIEIRVFIFLGFHKGTIVTIYNGDKRTAQQLADKELLKHFSSYKRNDERLNLISVEPIEGSDNNWRIRYDIASSSDSQVVVTVNTKTSTLVSYKDTWR